MVNKSQCSKKFKHLCDRTVSLTQKEVRAAKNYSKSWTNYSTIKELTTENKKQNISVKLRLQKETQILDALIQLDKERSDELDNIKEEIQVLEKQIKSIQDDESPESDRNKSLQLRLLQLMVLKMCTKTHINDKKIPQTVQGFAANEERSLTVPFSVDTVRLTKSEIQNSLWDSCYRSSGFNAEWDCLFSASSGANGSDSENAQN